MAQSQNPIVTKSRIISCNGGEDGHPKIYLHIKDEIGKIECPYCGKLYILETESKNGKVNKS